MLKGFAKLKLDERVVKILATLNVGGELEQIAVRGARRRKTREYLFGREDRPGTGRGCW